MYQHECDASVNVVEWASSDYGLWLAAGCADGRVCIVTRSMNDEWNAKSFEAHQGGINGLSWGPSTDPCLLMAENYDFMNP